jgi:hypothetical protein
MGKVFTKTVHGQDSKLILGDRDYSFGAFFRTECPSTIESFVAERSDLHLRHRVITKPGLVAQGN